MTLRPLVFGDRHAFVEALAQWGADFREFCYEWNPDAGFAALLERYRLLQDPATAPVGRVPYVALYAFEDGAIVGRVNVRLRLDADLESLGGHLGWAVVPGRRRQGWGLAMARQALDYCRGLGLRRVVVVCAASNTASRRIAESLGGRAVPVDQSISCLRYEIAL